MRLYFKPFLVSVISALGLSACLTTPNTSAYDPNCDFSAYAAAQASAQKVLLPMAPGSIADMPLDAVKINNQVLGKQVIPVDTRAERLPSRTLKASARIQNCTEETLVLEARTLFFDALDGQSEKPTAWSKVYVPGLSTGSYSTSSLNSDAESYIIEVRPGG